MASGTITLTNNSDAVSGVGTAFLTDLAAGDFIVANVGGIAYTLPVKSIASDTALTIINKFTGPTMSGLAWFIAKREQQAMITAALVAQSTEALRGLNFDKSNWQAVFSAAGDITVTMPDGTQFTGPSWQKIVTLLEKSDVEAIQPLVDQVRADAQQVAADKAVVVVDAAAVAQAKAGAVAAASTATQAKTDAEASKTAAAASQTAAKADADRAELAAGTVDMTNYLRKDDNLASLSDKNEARKELEVGRMMQRPSSSSLYGGDDRSVSNFLDINATGGGWGVFQPNGESVPLPEGAGGTGVKTVGELATKMGLKSSAKADIVGAVSQTGGVPTGAIIERGSNTNGEYVKFADGTMMCTGALPDKAIGASSSGEHTIVLASTMINNNFAVSASCAPSGTTDFYGHAYNYSFTRTGCVIGFKNGATATTTVLGRYVAIGRWF